jgi:hypothetical protein
MPSSEPDRLIRAAAGRLFRAGGRAALCRLRNERRRQLRGGPARIRHNLRGEVLGPAMFRGRPGPAAGCCAGFPRRSGAVAVTVTCTRSASTRSSGTICAMLSRTACRPSAFLAPCFALGAQLGGAFLHRGTLPGAEAAGLAPCILRGHSRVSFPDAQRPGVMPAFHRKARPGHTVALLDF